MENSNLNMLNQSFNEYIEQYIPVLIFLGIAFILAMVMLIIPFIAAKRNPYSIKNSPYECGFKQEFVPRKPFSIRFYLISILFIIFDVEIIFIVPWALNLTNMDLFAFWNVIVFLGILTIGLIYEWKKGALDAAK